MPVAQIGGKEIFYIRRRGEGRSVVLIHGAGGNHLHWPAPLHRLPEATVYAPDLPGHGRSGGEGRERIADYATDILNFLDGVGIEQAVLLGHSMGGAIAQTVALSAPRRVEGLVLIGTGARLPVSPQIRDGLKQDVEGTVQQITQWAWGPDADPTLKAEGQQTMLETGPDVLLGDFLACDRFDLRERIQEITIPTLVMTGSEDRMTPPRFGRWLAEQIPGARFRLVEGGGHMLMLERPAEVVQQVRDFL